MLAFLANIGLFRYAYRYIVYSKRKLFGHYRQKLADGTRLKLVQPMTLVGVVDQNEEHRCVRESHLSIEWSIVCRPNCLDATDVFMRKLILGMCHSLTNTALTLPPFIADAEGQQWIETQPM
jgi:hypothetical protein